MDCFTTFAMTGGGMFAMMNANSELAMTEATLELTMVAVIQANCHSRFLTTWAEYIIHKKIPSETPGMNF